MCSGCAAQWRPAGVHRHARATECARRRYFSRRLGSGARLYVGAHGSTFMSVHLVSLATRRNVGIWFFPLMVVLILLLEYSNGLMWSVSLWPEMSDLVGFSIVLIGPCIAAATAWMVARERLCGLTDLLVSTPSPAFTRW